MKVFAAIFVLFVSALLAGCGGSGGHHSTPSPFSGEFAGSWTSTDSSVGTADIAVQSSGNFSGSFVNTTDSITGTFSGHITGDGAIDGTLSFGGSNFPGTGNFTLSEDMNTMTGTLTDGTNTWTFTLTRTS